MKRIAVCLVLIGVMASPRLFAQASDIPSAAPTRPAGLTQEQLGRKLLDEMVEALGGQAWLDRKDMQVSGRTAAFFHGQPNLNVIEFTGWRQFPDATQQGAERIGFLTDKSMISAGQEDRRSSDMDHRQWLRGDVQGQDDAAEGTGRGLSAQAKSLH